MENFTINLTWNCPYCNSYQHDKYNSSSGAITDLFCGECGEEILLAEPEN